MRFLLPSIAVFLVPTLSPALAAPPKPSKGCRLAHIKQLVAASVKSGSKLDVMHCETGLFSGPAAYVYVREQRQLKEGTAYYERRLVFDNDTGKPIVDEPSRPLEGHRADMKLQLFDLDADGVTEVIETGTWRDKSSGWRGSWLRAYRLDGKKLVQFADMTLDFYGWPDMDGDEDMPPLKCSAKVKWQGDDDRGYQLIVSSKTNDESDLCLATGAHRFRFDGKKLVASR